MLTVVPLLLFGGLAAMTQTTPVNLALQAHASASEDYQGMTADKAIDGNMGTRWSGIPGHNEGVWYQLDWDKPVKVGEMVVTQYDRFTFEWDVQVWDAGTNDWKTVQHFGKPGERLAKVVLFRPDPPVETTKLRIGNITNGPSFNEVEVYAEPFETGLSTRIASDLNAGVVGIVTDTRGLAPVAGADVTLTGKGKRGEWKATAKSDDKGMFFAPLALGLTGPIQVRTVAMGKIGESAIDAADLQYGLTPLSTDQKLIPLDDWKFQPDPPDGFQAAEFDDSKWQKIKVPAHFEMEGFRSLDGIGGYRTHFHVPGGCTMLRFDGVYSGSEVWVNGKLIARHEGSTPFEADVTDAATPGDNVLALRVREHTVVSDHLDKMSQYADFPLAGIFRKAYLYHVPDAHIGALWLTPTFDKGYRDATIAARVAVDNAGGKQFGAAVRFSLKDRFGKAVAIKVDAAWVQCEPWSRGEVKASIAVPQPEKWSAEHPNLYELTVELLQNDKPDSHVTQRIGFRQTEISGTTILINGSPVKFRGTCHHDSHPTMGRAVTPELERQDITLMKEANLNALRTSHYPPIPELLAVADELGMYVEDEASFCWADVSNDLNNTPRIIQLEAELLARDRNHPSAFMWSLCNESEYGYGFERAHDWVRQMDPSRPTAAATSAWTEIATIHNPISLRRIEENANVPLPIMWDESFAPYQGIFNDVAEMWADPGIRDYYVVPLLPVYDKFMASKNIAGSQIWCWGDDIFCVPNRGLEYGRGTAECHFIENEYKMPGRGLVGDAPWGVVDGWRRRKPEFWLVKKMHSPIRVKEDPVTAASPIRVPVENQYDFTNLSELKVAWEIGGEKGNVSTSVAPRSSGEIAIQPVHAPKAGDVLSLTFTSARGVMVDSFRIPIGSEPAHLSSFDKLRMTTPLKIRDEGVLAGESTHVVGNGFELAFDRGSGQLRRCVAFGEPLLLELPALHVLPTNRPMSPLPDRLTWDCQGIDVKAEGDNVRVTVKGKYDKFDGAYDLLIEPAGEVTVHSSFKYTGDDMLAREVGLRLSVPRGCDLLQWDRKAEWRVYPADHIGRPTGEARAFSAHDDAVPPKWEWSQDNSPMGSNDFRSAKRNVYWASLRYPSGPGIVALSDGTHAARANVETDRISLYICDWYGGTNVGWGEWVQNYGRGKEIKKGDTLESTLHLRFFR